jgi:hypothetical protein
MPKPIPQSRSPTGELVVEILAHGSRLWPVDGKCKEEENAEAVSGFANFA